MSEKPFTPWIVAAEDGKIITGHCNCMAELGECCSHVASLLWAIESGVCIRSSLTVTQKKAYWAIPSAVKEVQYAPVKDITFKGRKWTLASLMSSPQHPSQAPTLSSISSAAISSPSLSSPAASSPQLGTKTSKQLSAIPAPTEAK